MQTLKYIILLLVLFATGACQAVAPSVLPIVPQVKVQVESSVSGPVPSIYDATLQEENPVTAEISTKELQQILAEDSALMLDARPFMEYAVSHIPGARNVAPKPGIAMSEYTSDVAEVGRLVDGNLDQAIVLYCNGPFCGKSKRVAEDMLAEGYTDVRRYQLGAPVWRALGGQMVIEPEGVAYVYDNDATAVFVDARSAEAFAAGSLSGARHIPLDQVAPAKDDGRLPMHDHNTRIIVFGTDGVEAQAVAEAIIHNAFHNVTYFAGDYAAIETAVGASAAR